MTEDFDPFNINYRARGAYGHTRAGTGTEVPAIEPGLAANDKPGCCPEKVLVD